MPEKPPPPPPGVPPPPPYGGAGLPPSPLATYLTQYENTSGQGESAPVPPEIKGWNWGGFLLGWIWAAVHKAWLGLILCLLVGIVGSIVCGAMGNEWAWKHNRYDSVEHFREVQRKWAVAGAIVASVFCVIWLLWFGMVVFFVGFGP